MGVIFTGQKLGDWHKVYGIWIGRVFVGLSIAKPIKPRLGKR